MNVKKLLVFTLILLAGTFRATHATQLSGTYTIDATATATSTSFKTVSSAIAYLTGVGSRTDGGPANTAPFGVSGPVVFMIAPGTYAEQVTLKGVVDGASPVNTITFEGTDAATRTISFAATTTTLISTIRLDSTKYVRLRNLTIVANGTFYGWGIHITNANSNDNKVTHCTINITGNGAMATTNSYCGIVVGGSPTSATTGVALDSLEIDSNTINSGYYGIICSGLSSHYQVANKIRYNKVYSSYSYGIYTTYQDGVNISDNTVILRPTVTTNNGILVMNSNSTTTSTGVAVNRNRISNFGVYGIRISSVLNSYAGTKGEICNNMIGGGITGTASAPLSMNGSSYWNISNNSINHDIATAAIANSAMSITGGFNINILNNLVAETKGGSGLPLYATTSTAIDTMNYNVYYRSDTSNNQLISIGGVLYNTGSFIRSATTDSNSIFQSPRFINDTNLHLLNSCNRGIALSYITTDIDGTPRLGMPVIGAHETQVVADNIAVMEMTGPVEPVDTGMQDLVVRVRNVGSTTITSFNISYSLNNGTPVSQPWTGILAPCDTISVTFTGSNSIQLGEVNYVKVYTDLPNGVADGDVADDTLNKKYYYVLNGTYTVGGPGGDFATLTDARDALQQRGVSGPATFMLNPGTFSGQLIITGPISGASASDSITFEGTDASTRIITTSINSAATVILNQCNYVHFRNITINNTYAGSCAGFAWVGSNTNTNGRCNSIKHCVVNLANLNTASAIGIVATGSANGFTISNNRMDSLVVDSNMITGCNTGVNMRGNTAATNSYNRNYKVSANMITTTDAQSDLGVFISNVYNGIEANYNNVTAIGGVGIYFTSCGNNFSGNASHEISYNRIKSGYGGIQMDGSPCFSANASRLYNNNLFIRSSLIATGIYIFGGGVDEIYHNTIQIDSASALFLGMCLNYDGSDSSEVKNNIFSYSGSSSGGTIYPAYFASGVKGDNLNYNVYYNNAGNDLVFRNGVAYGSADLLTDSTGGDSSFNIKPAFTSDTDLHLTTGCPRGVDLTGVITDDIDGIARSTSPSMGCYEFGGYTNDVQVQKVLQPTIPVAVGAQDLQVLLANNGNNVITSLTISYVLNGGTPVTLPWTGYFAPCDTMSVYFTGTNQLNVANALNTLKVYSSMPNGTSDGNPLNDTIMKQIAPALNGNYIIGPVPSDFIDFTSAADALTQRGISGRVVFDVKSGTYHEAISLSEIVGTSAVNTVTFRSMAGHRDSVLLENSGAATSVVSLLGTSYINFRNLSISQMASANYNSAMFMTRGASFDSIENCSLIVPAFVADVNMAFYTNALTGTGVVVRNNVISGGYGGIIINLFDGFLNPNTITYNHLIENNTIVNANTSSIFIYRTLNLTLRNNIILPDPSNNSHTGIQLETCDSSLLVSGNSIIGATGGYGLYMNGCTGATATGAIISNNVVSIGGSTASAFGIYVIASTGIRYYNNSINNTSTGSVNNVAGYFGGSGDYDIVNNIFCNSGGGPALSIDATTHHFDYNNLYTTGAVLAKYFSTSYANLAAWRASTNTPDIHSVSYRPGFTSSTDLQPDLSDSACWSLNGRGIHLADNTIDFNNNTRPSVLAEGAPDIGAYEFTPACLPPLAIPDIAVPVPGDTQVFMSVFAPKDTVAIIYWDVTNPFFPDTVVIRQYSGEKPFNIGTASNYMYFYTDMDGVSTLPYNYSIDVYYKQTWLGTIPQESDMRITKKIPDAAWTVDLNSYSTVDTSRNILMTMYQMDSSAVFSGTDMYNPLPVKLLGISALKSVKNAIINWATTSELNSSFFEIERSYNGKSFEPVGQVKAQGKGQGRIDYTFTDINPSLDFTFTGPIYYKLKMIDRDGAFAYSKVVQVSWNKSIKESLTVFPNPFTKEVFATFESQGPTDVRVEWMDITGKVLERSVHTITEGTTTLNMLPAMPLSAGIYFVSVDINGTRQVYKLIKK